MAGGHLWSSPILLIHAALLVLTTDAILITRYTALSNCFTTAAPTNGQVNCKYTSNQHSSVLCVFTCDKGHHFDGYSSTTTSLSKLCNGTAGFIQASSVPVCVETKQRRAPVPARASENSEFVTCTTWGSNHYQTFDKRVYTFNGPCKYMLAYAKEKFNILIINDPNCKQIACYRGLDIFFADTSIKLRSSNAENGTHDVLWNGKPFKVPGSKSGSRFEQVGTFLTLSTPVGFTIKWDGKAYISIQVSTDLKGKMTGLCGTYNGDPTDDFEGQTGQSLISVANFGVSWKQSSLYETPCQDTRSESGCKSDTPQHQAIKKMANDKCKDLVNEPVFKLCHEYVDPQEFVSSCESDCCDSEADGCRCSTMEAYSRACLEYGIKLSWRRPGRCEAKCSGGKIFKECGSSCQADCSNVKAVCPDTSCVEGCFCPDGRVLHNGVCIETKYCSCMLNGAETSSGMTITLNCNTCKCHHGGWDCTTNDCPSKCYIYGDAHYRTFDHSTFNFLGKCSYYLLRTQDLDIIVDNEGCILGVPCSKSVQIIYHKQKIKMEKNHRLFLDGHEILQLPLRTSNFLVSQVSSLFLQLKLSNGITVMWDGRTRMHIMAPPTFKGKTKGLCGTYDGKQSNDFMTPQNSWESDPVIFGNQWKTHKSCSDSNTKTISNPCDMQLQRRSFAQNICQKLKSELFAVCHSVHDVEEYYKNCMFDICSCEKNLQDCLCPSLGNYADACAAKSVNIEWRLQVDECKLTCPVGQVYQVCGRPCERTCRNVAENEDENCNHHCVEGCNCPIGKALNDKNECVPIATCPCIFNGREYAAGYITLKDTELCTCKSAKWECTKVYMNKAISNIQPLCGDLMEYSSCAPMCPDTCDNSQDTDTCEASTECEPGCVCKQGYIRYGEKCIPKTQCPCSHGGKDYYNGDFFYMDCNKCECQNQQWQCEEKNCSATCIAYGDSHYSTFDGHKYDFQGACDYILAQSTEDAEYKFVITIQNMACGTSGVTCAKGVNIMLGDAMTSSFYSLRLMRGRRIVKDPRSPFKISEVGQMVYVQLPSGIEVEWDRGTRIYIRSPTPFMNKVKGLCGNFNGDRNDDFTLRQSGPPVVSPTTFGDNWRMHSYCEPSKVVEDTCQLVPHRKSWAQSKCSIMSSELFEPCHASVGYDDYMERCVFDACACDQGGDCECLCTAVAAYAHECASHGIPIKWRTKDFCGLQCESCQEYNPCMSRCPKKTCANRLVYETLAKGCEQERGVCFEGCDLHPCPEGQVYDSLVEPIACIPEPLCDSKSCKVGGKDYKEGERVYDSTVCNQECEICNCRNGKIDHISIGACSNVVSTVSTPPSVTVTPKTPVDCVEPGWSAWMSGMVPTHKNVGDRETIEGLRKKYSFCAKNFITDIKCRIIGQHVEGFYFGQKVTCELNTGFTCHHSKQGGGMCLDYEVSFYCNCPITSVVSTPSTSVTTETTLTDKTTSPTTTTSSETTSLPKSTLSETTSSEKTTTTDMTTSPRTTTSSETTSSETTSSETTSSETTSSETTSSETTSPTKTSSETTSSEKTTLPTTTSSETTSSEKTTSLTKTTSETTTSPQTTTLPKSTSPETTSSETTMSSKTTTSPQTTTLPKSTSPETTSSETTMPSKTTTSPETTTLPKSTSSETTSSETTSSETTMSSKTTTSPQTITSIETTSLVSTTPVVPKSPTPSCGWTSWMNSFHPDPDGDLETISNLRLGFSFCAFPIDIMCRAVPDESYPNGIRYDQTGQKAVSCDLNRGLVCVNNAQTTSETCFDYEVMVKCADDCKTTTSEGTTAQYSTETTFVPYYSTSSSASPNTTGTTIDSVSTTGSTTDSVSTTGSTTASVSTTRSTTASVSTTRSTTDSVSTTGSTTASVSTTRSTTASVSTTGSTTDSVSTTGSTTDSVSTTRSTTDSVSTTGSTTDSVSTTGSTTDSVSTTGSTTASVSTTGSTTASVSTTGSTTDSVSTTGSTTDSVSKTGSTTDSVSTTGSTTASVSTTGSTTDSVSTTGSTTASVSTTGSTTASVLTTGSTTDSVSTTGSTTASVSTTGSTTASVSTTGSTTASVSTTGSTTDSVSTTGSTTDSVSTTGSTTASVSTTGSTTDSVSTTGSTTASVSTTGSTTDSVSTTGSTTASVSSPGTTIASVSSPWSTTNSVSTPESTTDRVSTPESTTTSISTPASTSTTTQTSSPQSTSYSTSATTSQLTTVYSVSTSTTTVTMGKTVCDFLLGLYNPTLLGDDHFTSSSSSDVAFDAQNGRLNNVPQGFTNGGAWVPRLSDKNPRLIIDLKHQMNVSGIVTQGRPDANEWVTKYQVFVSEDGTTFQPYSEDKSGKPKVFISNFDKNTAVKVFFKDQIPVRKIAIHPVDFHNGMAMRVDLLACASIPPPMPTPSFSTTEETEVTTTVSTEGTTKSPTTTTSTDGTTTISTEGTTKSPTTITSTNGTTTTSKEETTKSPTTTTSTDGTTTTSKEETTKSPTTTTSTDGTTTISTEGTTKSPTTITSTDGTTTTSKEETTKSPTTTTSTDGTTTISKEETTKSPTTITSTDGTTTISNEETTKSPTTTTSTDGTTTISKEETTKSPTTTTSTDGTTTTSKEETTKSPTTTTSTETTTTISTGESTKSSTTTTSTDGTTTISTGESTKSSTTTTSTEATTPSSTSTSTTSTSPPTTTEKIQVQCDWSPWLNSDSPSSDPGDMETISSLKQKFGICQNVTNIECRVAGTATSSFIAGQVVKCDPFNGLRCYNQDQQSEHCYDYEVKLYCWDKSCLYPPPPFPPTQSTTTTTTAETSTISTMTPFTKVTDSVIRTTVPCPPGTEWTSCAYSCKDACNYHALKTGGCEIEKSDDCMPGCKPIPTNITCKSHERLNEKDVCINIQMCACLKPDGTPSKPMEVWQNPDAPCARCSCINNEIVCTTENSDCTTPEPMTSTTTFEPIVCGWSEWFNNDSPTSGDGDHELISYVKNSYGLCSTPLAIECREVSTQKDSKQSNQVLTCSLSEGLKCYNYNNLKGCFDYEIRIFCPCISPPTYTSLTTAVTSSTTTDVTYTPPSSTTTTGVTSTAPSSTTTTGVTSTAPSSTTTTGVTSTAPSSTTTTGVTSTAPSSTTTTGVTSTAPSSTTTTGVTSTAPSSTTTTGVTYTPPSSTTTTGVTSTAPSSTATTGVTSTAPSSTTTTGVTSTAPSSTTTTGVTSTAPSSTTTTGVTSTAPSSTTTTGVTSTAPSSTTTIDVTSSAPSSTTTTGVTSTAPSSTTTTGVTSTAPSSTTTTGVTSTAPSSTTTIVVTSTAPSSTTTTGVASTAPSSTTPTGVTSTAPSSTTTTGVTSTAPSSTATIDVTSTAPSSTTTTDVTSTAPSSTTTTGVTSTAPSSTTTTDVTSTAPSSTTTTGVTSTVPSSTATTGVTSTAPSSTTTTDVASTAPSSTTTIDVTSTAPSSTTTTGITSTAPSSTTTTGVTSTAPSSTTTTGVTSTAPSSTTTTGVTSTAPSLTTTTGVTSTAPSSTTTTGVTSTAPSSTATIDVTSTAPSSTTTTGVTSTAPSSTTTIDVTSTAPSSTTTTGVTSTTTASATTSTGKPVACGWTDWMNECITNAAGDIEDLTTLRRKHDFCANPAIVNIECRNTVTNKLVTDDDTTIICDINRGLVCFSHLQPMFVCPEFEVRFMCDPIGAGCSGTGPTPIVNTTQPPPEKECMNELGLRDGTISDDKISASSVRDSTHSPSHGRFRGPSSWMPQFTDKNQYLQVDLGADNVVVTGIKTEGNDFTGTYVKEFIVLYSDDGNSWNSIRETKNHDKIFKNKGGSSSTIVFKFPIRTRYIRVNPQSWNGDISMRMEVIGCPYTITTPTPPTSSGNITTTPFTPTPYIMTTTPEPDDNCMEWHHWIDLNRPSLFDSGDYEPIEDLKSATPNCGHVMSIECRTATPNQIQYSSTGQMVECNSWTGLRCNGTSLIKDMCYNYEARLGCLKEIPACLNPPLPPTICYPGMDTTHCPKEGCSPGFYCNGIKCVLKADCPCAVDGKIMKVNSIIRRDNCDTCQCLNGEVICVPKVCPSTDCLKGIANLNTTSCDCQCDECSPHEYQCGDGECIPGKRRCDKIVDCIDDELDCEDYTRPPTLPTSTVSVIISHNTTTTTTTESTEKPSISIFTHTTTPTTLSTSTRESSTSPLYVYTTDTGKSTLSSSTPSITTFGSSTTTTISSTSSAPTSTVITTTPGAPSTTTTTISSTSSAPTSTVITTTPGAPSTTTTTPGAPSTTTTTPGAPSTTTTTPGATSTTTTTPGTTSTTTTTPGTTSTNTTTPGTTSTTTLKTLSSHVPASTTTSSIPLTTITTLGASSTSVVTTTEDPCIKVTCPPLQHFEIHVGVSVTLQKSKDGCCQEYKVCKISDCKIKQGQCYAPYVSLPTPMSPTECCPKYQCACPSECPKATAPKCPLGSKIFQVDQGCNCTLLGCTPVVPPPPPISECRYERFMRVPHAITKRSVTVSHIDVHKLNDFWKDGPCKVCSCINGTKENAEVSCIEQQCTPCKQGEEMVSKSDENCCGECQPIGCFHEGKIYKDGEKIPGSKKCFDKVCQKSLSDGSFFTHEKQVKCPSIPDLPICDNVTQEAKMKDDDGCCWKCIPDPRRNLTNSCSTCAPQLVFGTNESSIGYFKITKKIGVVCTNTKPLLDLKECLGHCSSRSVYTSVMQGYSNTCQCCQVDKSTEYSVLLSCSDGSKLKKKFQMPQSCSCKACSGGS